MSDIGNKAIIASNIEKYMKLHGETRRDLCSVLGVPYMTVSNWVKANTYPRIDKIEMMANHWGIMKSDLVEREKETPAISDEGREDDMKLLAAINALPPDRKEALLRFLGIE